MHKREEDLYIRRAEKFLEKITGLWTEESVLFKAEFSRSDEPVPFSERMDRGRGDEWKSAKEGDSWGREWNSAWFHLTGTIPLEWKGSTVAAYLDFSGEALIFNEKGEAVTGAFGQFRILVRLYPALASPGGQLQRGGGNPSDYRSLGQ